MLGIGLSAKEDLITLSIMKSLPLDINASMFTYIGFFSALSTLAAWAVKNNWRVIIKRIDEFASVQRTSL